jgi:hypothetical protein
MKPIVWTPRALVGIALTPLWMVVLVGVVVTMATVWYVEDWVSPERF